MELGFAMLSLFAAGLLGGGHCLGMCGGIVGALSLSAGSRSARLTRMLCYNLGRVISYSLMGALVGWGGEAVFGTQLTWPRLMAGVLLVLMGLYLADLWRALTWLERAGAVLWRRLQPLGNRLLPLKHHWQALPLGLVWGFLPCGLVYTGLAFAAAQGNPLNGGLVMLAFGLGTLPAVLLGGWFASELQAIIRARGPRLTAGLLLIAFGLWTLWVALAPGHH